MTHELYTSGGVDCDKLLEPEWSDPPTDAEEESNGASKQDGESACENAKNDLPIIIHDSDSCVSSDSGSSDSSEPISRKARKLAIENDAKNDLPICVVERRKMLASPCERLRVRVWLRAQ